jgi:hypothetical protein
MTLLVIFGCMGARRLRPSLFVPIPGWLFSGRFLLLPYCIRQLLRFTCPPQYPPELKNLFDLWVLLSVIPEFEPIKSLDLGQLRRFLESKSFRDILRVHIFGLGAK